MPPPVIIVGHWRSGTTHLHQLLACDPQFAYPTALQTGLPWNFLLAARPLKPLLDRALPRDRYVDAIPVTPTSPQEDEIALANMVRVSFLHGVYFPHRFYENLNRGLFFDHCSPADVECWQASLACFIDKLSIQAAGRPLLLKNPSHTPRVARLRALWPDAKFIHIVRNPYLVYESTKRFHSRMLAALALQRYDHVDIEGCVLDTYARLMQRLFENIGDLPPERFVEVHLDDLVRDPFEQLTRICAQVRLDGFAETQPHFVPYLNQVKDHQPETRNITSESAERVDAHWQPIIRRWGYQAPLAPSS